MPSNDGFDLNHRRILKIERWWKNGVLVRETRDGKEHADNLGKLHASHRPRGSGIGIPADLPERTGIPADFPRAGPVTPAAIADRPSVVANATGAAFRVARAAMKGEIVRASASEIDRRLAICKTCEHFVDNPMKCRKCGCFLNLKTRLETEHCPIAKW